MSEKAKLSPEEKAEIVRKCLRNEISIGTASQEVCVNRTTILRWIAQYETEGVSSPVIKCKKTPRKKCSFVAEVKGKR